MLKPQNTVLVIVDVQGKLAQLMHDKEALFANLQRLIQGIQVLEVPIIWLEQNPKGLGPTIPEVAALLPDGEPIPKFSFSCCGNAAFMRALRGAQRANVLLCGIETHVCIYQTAMDLLALGYGVHVVADAVSSRTAENCHIALDRMRDARACITSTEMALFELLRTAKAPQFKAIAKIVK
jgi:nicotinamidase-related amidase